MPKYPYTVYIVFPRLEGNIICANVVRTIHQTTRKATTLTADKTKSPTNFRETSKCYASLIQECISTKSLENLKNLQFQMMGYGFPHLSLGNKLIDGYLKCGGIAEARVLFDELPQRHVVVWNSMISGYIKQKKSKEAVLLYKRMFFEGVFPDGFTLSVVFKGFSDLGLVGNGRQAHGHAVVLGLDVCDVFVASGLVDMYAKFGLMRGARLVADRVVEKDVVMFTALIVGYSQHGDDGEALEIFQSMLKEGVKANDHTLASVLASCGNMDDLCEGKMIHGLTIKSGFESSVAAQTSVLAMYSCLISLCMWDKD